MVNVWTGRSIATSFNQSLRETQRQRACIIQGHLSFVHKGTGIWRGSWMRVKQLDIPHAPNDHNPELLPVSALANISISTCQKKESSLTTFFNLNLNSAIRCTQEDRKLTERGSWDVRDWAVFKGTKQSWTPATTRAGRLVTHRTSSAALALDKTALLIQALLTSANALSQPSTCNGPCKSILNFSDQS